MPWISKVELDFLKERMNLNAMHIFELENQLNKQRVQIARLQRSSTAQTWSMGEVDLAKLARKIDEIIRKVENGQLSNDAAGRLIQDMLNAYYRGQQ